jgi:ATP-binding cassette subfamily B protein
VADHGTIQEKELKGDVRFENVWFAYKEEQYVLKNISFHAQPGESLALVGATGSGKTSVINLLTRFYEYQKGRVLLDGIPIEDYSVSFLRKHIGLVLQDVFLFNGTIRDNITLGSTEITDEQIRRAAELVGASRFIENLPGGFDYPVMERGNTLSVGQRQLISFVRAMVYDPQILILDEATSSVDSETEELIQQAVEKIMKGRTSVVIAHRLSTIQKANQIMVLDKGEIKETGTHESLMSQKGLYARMHEVQYKTALL